jgi:hypothetical protein
MRKLARRFVHTKNSSQRKGNPRQNHGEYLQAWTCSKELEAHHEEILAAESESLEVQSLDSTPKSSPDPKHETPREEEPLPLEFLHSFKEDLFEDYRNTSNYLYQKRPLVPVTPPEPYEKKFLRENIKELTSLMSNEWLREGELSLDLLQISHPSSNMWKLFITPLSAQISCEIILH